MFRQSRPEVRRQCNLVTGLQFLVRSAPMTLRRMKPVSGTADVSGAPPTRERDEDKSFFVSPVPLPRSVGPFLRTLLVPTLD